MRVIGRPQIALARASTGVNTLGEAYRLGWRVRARRLVTGPKPKSPERTAIFCDETTELDLKTLDWTRGDRFELDQLAEPPEIPPLRQSKHPAFL